MSRRLRCTRQCDSDFLNASWDFLVDMTSVNMTARERQRYQEFLREHRDLWNAGAQGWQTRLRSWSDAMRTCTPIPQKLRAGTFPSVGIRAAPRPHARKALAKFEYEPLVMS